ncbi:MAG TPA: HAD family phosphatase [Actinomycetes bacterium]|jgi:epoxide hydrolase-like predicted phosphatase|nr:HAD family phosphatase [Actinomycetes bacterium]
MGAAERTPAGNGRPLGLLLDYGGVLTTSVLGSFESFCQREGLARSRLVDLLRCDRGAREAVVALEVGDLGEAEFEGRMAALLGVRAEGLLSRLMCDATPDLEMRGAVRAARRQGVRTGLVSNSWGSSRYPRAELMELFHGIVISGEVGVRKPSRAIYELGARSVGLSPEQCVFVDDLPVNVEAAQALGMAAVHHHDTAGTISELERLLGIPLANGRP